MKEALVQAPEAPKTPAQAYLQTACGDLRYYVNLTRMAQDEKYPEDRRVVFKNALETFTFGMSDGARTQFEKQRAEYGQLLADQIIKNGGVKHA